MMDKEELLRQLEDTHREMLEMLRGIDPEMLVYEETGWRVKDIVGHVATWDNETLHSIHEHRRGGEYSIPDYDDAEMFNTFAARARYNEPFDQILSGWEATRNWLRIQIRALTPEELAAEMTYPSGQHGTVGDLLREIAEHEAEHMAEIREAQERAE